MAVPLFEGYPDVEPAQPEKLSPDRRRTLSAKERISVGVHPANGLPLADNGQSCGTCTHLTRVHGRYLKCGQGSMSRSATSDIRAWWPACPMWAWNGEA